MNTTIDVITLEVEALEPARDFYEQAFGATVGEEADGTLTLGLGGNASRFALRTAAADACAGPTRGFGGFRGFTLSYILESADGVDAVLERAQCHGGRISKPPKNALWGYSAYVTDPSGCLWKVASSKRRPLIGRGGAPVDNGHVVEPQEVPITIGVADIKRAKTFYEEGLGLPIKKSYRKFVMFSGGDGASDLGLYTREALADDAGVSPEGNGFRGFDLTHVVDSDDSAQTLLERAVRAGGSVVEAPPSTPEGSCSGQFADPDGNLWKLATAR